MKNIWNDNLNDHSTLAPIQQEGKLHYKRLLSPRTKNSKSHQELKITSTTQGLTRNLRTHDELKDSCRTQRMNKDSSRTETSLTHPHPCPRREGGISSCAASPEINQSIIQLIIEHLSFIGHLLHHWDPTCGQLIIQILITCMGTWTDFAWQLVTGTSLGLKSTRR